MWIVRLALRLPYTFAVLSILILLMGVYTASQMATDILPVINIPVVTVIWSYGGMAPSDMEKRFIYPAERMYTSSVNDVEHMESQTVAGIGVIRIYFQPNAELAQGIAQVTASSQVALRAMPPGTQPPLIIRFDASDVPVIRIAVSGSSESQAQLFDYASNFIRTALSTIQGTQIPSPYGGTARMVVVDLDLQKCFEHGLSPTDVSNALGAQNLVLPTGDAKIGTTDYTVEINSSPKTVAALNDLPIREQNGAMIRIRDVANVRDGGAVQTNIVHRNGGTAVLLTVLKSGSASTLDVVKRVKDALPGIQATLPKDLNVELLGDQSVFVRGAVQSVVREAVIAACLTALMILLFLGSVRSTLIVAVSIPLSILTSIIVLGSIGQTLNTMTLGGLALSVGILVDDTTVTIENINRYLGLGLPLRKAILEGSAEIALPALVSTLSICIVFLPVALLFGVAKYLFVPLAEAVVFAMLASYFLSRTVTPTFVAILLKNEASLYREEYEHQNEEDEALGEAVPDPRASHNGRGRKLPSVSADEARNVARIKRGITWKIHSLFEYRFERMRERYRQSLEWTMHHRASVLIAFVCFCAVSFCLGPFIGQDFFPSVDAGQFRLHVRVPPNTRIDETSRIFEQIEQDIRTMVPKKETSLILDDIGLPYSTTLATSDSATVGPSDGEITVSLTEDHHPTNQYVELLRQRLPKDFPDDSFFFEPSDIVSEILDFGLPSPIDVQISGPIRNQPQNLQVAIRLRDKIATIPGAADAHLQQIVNAPALMVNVDRMKAEQIGITQQQVADTLLVSLAGTGQASPNYWLDPKSGVNYGVTVMTPQYFVNSPDSILSTPLNSPALSGPQLLSNVATLDHIGEDMVINHYNIMPVYDVYATPQNRDLGGVAADIEKLLPAIQKQLPRGSKVAIRGQVVTMHDSFGGLALGLVAAVILVYLLITVNFQSWVDPVVVVSGVPCALSGILWILFATRTTISVPSLMGAIMTIGVSTANSVLLVTFANERRTEGMSAMQAAIDAGSTRMRPILMTAIAMIVGMIPMALGLGEGGEQNAPLGRAVIGGLLVATFSTLFLVPIVYTFLRAKQPVRIEDDDLEPGEPVRRAKPWPTRVLTLPHANGYSNGNGNGNGRPAGVENGGAPRRRIKRLASSDVQFGVERRD